ncbi:-substrate-specific enzyme activase, putative [Babesia ovata]|uniref:-substrate-specific enzyme activase, putative n=1 Tax=Babesia ovata TaxID=189622 RepID=A0A2H6KB15_9APIC|nr:-substrate-specific enzyme activase, putative [Babesia ovata]GBE60180.1 -substrate-specific enzyme activase, putative [Babesia ovata]
MFCFQLPYPARGGEISNAELHDIFEQRIDYGGVQARTADEGHIKQMHIPLCSSVSQIQLFHNVVFRVLTFILDQRRNQVVQPGRNGCGLVAEDAHCLHHRHDLPSGSRPALFPETFTN